MMKMEDRKAIRGRERGKAMREPRDVENGR